MANERITFYLETHCNRNFAHRFTCLFFSEDQERTWYLQSSAKRLSTKPITNPPSELPVRLLTRLKVNPHFACPYCHHRSLYRCQVCQQFSCWDGETIYMTCANPACRHQGKIVVDPRSQRR
jgi:hypothetical protein